METAESQRNRRKTINGKLLTMWSNQKTNSKRRGHRPPIYTKEEFYEWCLNQELFHELFKNWLEGDCIRSLSPSADRIDDSKGYSFENIRLMTWGENKALYEANMVGTPVDQVALDGTVVATYRSQKEASRAMNCHQSNIYAAITCGYSAMNYKWRYSNGATK